MSNGIKYLFMILLTVKSFKVMLFIDSRYFCDCGRIHGQLEG